MSELDRVYKLTIIKAPEVIETENFDGSYFEQLETITEITDHRIEFSIEKHLKAQPNSAELTITNLSTASRDALVRGATKIRFLAGYDGNPGLLFVGDVRFVSNEREGTDWHTKLQVADGARAYADARVNRAYAKGTPLATIVADFAKAFGVSLPSEIAALPDFKSRLVTGEAVSGYAADELSRFLARYGFEWSFQNERLQILRFGDPKAGTVRLLSQDDGLIGAPTITPPKITAPPKAGSKAKAPKVPKLSVRHLLYPEIMPGEKLDIQSRSINGTFRADVVKHEGDTFGDDWTTTVEGTEVT